MREFMLVANLSFSREGRPVGVRGGVGMVRGCWPLRNGDPLRVAFRWHAMVVPSTWCVDLGVHDGRGMWVATRTLFICVYLDSLTHAS